SCDLPDSAASKRDERTSRADAESILHVGRNRPPIAGDTRDRISPSAAQRGPRAAIRANADAPQGDSSPRFVAVNDDLNPGSIYASFLVLLVGWGLGILSSPITDAIRRRSVKQRMTRAVATELQSLQDALASVVIQVSRRRGVLTHSL